MQASKSNEEETLFLYACQSGELELARALLDGNREIVNSTGLEGRTGLMIAAIMGHLTVVKLLVDAGADSRATDEWGYNALLLAIPGGHSKIVNFLFKKCDLTCDTPLGQINPITEAALHGHTSIANIILELYSRNFLNTPVPLSGMTPLMLAVTAGDVPTVKALVKRHADSKMRNSSGMTASDLACYTDNDTIKDLLGVNTRLATLSPSFFTYQHQHPSELTESPNDPVANFQNFKHLMVHIEDSTKLDPRYQHALTPNARAPNKRQHTSQNNKPTKGFSLLNIIKMRSRSASPRKPKRRIIDENSSDGIFEYILQTAGLLDFWVLFKENEIDLRVFLTLNDEDLDLIGITSKKEKIEILRLIDRYKNVL